MRYQYQPKHMKELEVARVPLAARGLRSGAAAAAVTAALLPALLATPALAATQIGIDGNTYTKAASGNGSGGGTWSWGGNDADPLNLNGYNGGAISWQGGDLVINATGQNTVGSEDVTMTYSDPQVNNGEGVQYTGTATESIHESTADGGTVTRYTNENADSFIYNYSNGVETADTSVQGYSNVVVTDKNGNVVDPKGSLTITGGGTVTTKAGVDAPGSITVNGGTTLTSGGGINAGGFNYISNNNSDITVSDRSTLSSGRMVTASGNVTVSGGSVLQTTYGYGTIPDVEVFAALSTGKDVIVTDSSVDLSSGHVNVGGRLAVTRSDFRCSEYLMAGSLSLDGSELRSGTREDSESGVSIGSECSAYYNRPGATEGGGEGLSQDIAFSKSATAAEKAAPSTATATTGVLAVRQTPVAASNAPAESADDAVYQTFIVSSVGEEAASGTFALGFSVGSDYAGRAAKVYVQHEDGSQEVLDATVDANGVVNVTTKKLSRYTVVISKETSGSTETPSATTTTASVKPGPAAKPAATHAATTKPAAAHAAASESLPQTGDPFGATSAVLAALGTLAFFEARHLRREA